MFVEKETPKVSPARYFHTGAIMTHFFIIYYFIFIIYLLYIIILYIFYYIYIFLFHINYFIIHDIMGDVRSAVYSRARPILMIIYDATL